MDEEAARFYERFGFEPSPLWEDQLRLLLKDARRVAGGDFCAVLAGQFTSIATYSLSPYSHHLLTISAC